jgi:hypothetical protein
MDDDKFTPMPRLVAIIGSVIAAELTLFIPVGAIAVMCPDYPSMRSL